MQLPQEVQRIIQTLQNAGFEAFAVGGCVRDLLLEREPQDWDVTTNAKPEEIQKLFPKHFYSNRFGTVTILTGSRELNLGEIEVTTYRVDVGYSDQRHPDSVEFTTSLKEDLARRDFTVNAMALIASHESPVMSHPPSPQASDGQGQKDAVTIGDVTVIDPFGGLKDLDARVIRAVGDPAQRFGEDALRLLRAVRFAAQLDFAIEETTLQAIKEHAQDIAAVSHERIRDELVKLVMSKQPERGFTLLKDTGLLQQILPEVAEGIGVEQSKHHIYTVYDHNVKSLQWAANYDYPLHIRLAALLHDIGKPRTRRPASAPPSRKASDGHSKASAGKDTKTEYTFYAHDIVGARMAEKLLKRLRFSNEIVEQVTRLVRHHMFYYDVGKVTEAGARRLLRRVEGKETFADLIKVRIAERKGSGVPKAEPYRLRHLQFLVEKAAQEPVSVGQLKIGGNDLIKELGVRPGPIIGGILNALLAEVLDDPAKNARDYLLQRAEELKDKDPKELKTLGEAAKEEEEKRKEEDIRRKYHV